MKGRQMLRVRQVVSGDAVWLRLAGDVERATVPKLNGALAAAERDDAATIGLEMSDVGFIDASGLHALASAAQRARRGNRRFMVAHPGTAVGRVLRLTALDRALDVRDPVGVVGR